MVSSFRSKSGLRGGVHSPVAVFFSLWLAVGPARAQSVETWDAGDYTGAIAVSFGLSIGAGLVGFLAVLLGLEREDVDGEDVWVDDTSPGGTVGGAVVAGIMTAAAGVLFGPKVYIDAYDRPEGEVWGASLGFLAGLGASGAIWAKGSPKLAVVSLLMLPAVGTALGYGLTARRGGVEIAPPVPAVSRGVNGRLVLGVQLLSGRF